MEIGGKICSPSGAVIFVAKYGVNLRSPSGAVIFVFWACNTYYRPAGAWKIIHNAKATNMDAPLGLCVLLPPLWLVGMCFLDYIYSSLTT